MKFLFWNTHKNININNLLSELILENNISFVILAEYNANIDELILLLSKNKIFMKKYFCNCERIKILGSIIDVEPARDLDYATIQIINKKDILCCVHLNSKIYSGNDSVREIVIEDIIHNIQELETEIETSNTIIVGDFNMNPYDSGFIDARYFHGIPICEEAERKSRIVAGKEYFMFYNPMWNLLGDFTKPYGTYYYNGGVENTFWNIFDQVIFRPVLKKRFVNSSLKILTETKTRYLLNDNNHPNKNISDHLPITFEFKEV